MPSSSPRPARLAAAAGLSLLLGAAPALAAPPAPRTADRSSAVLHELNDAVARLAARVSPAVVQIEVSGYGLAGEAGRDETAFVARHHTIGSGVIVEPGGWIVTNHHVVRGARRIQVVLSAPSGAPGTADATARRIFAARLVGADPAVDLALLKIEATGLPHLPLDGQVKVSQGELVFAIGSPQGLASTITMGVVGSAGRQVEFAQPLAYIQTDAPINPGNSGGPLVDVDGALVGLNTFIVSQSGGSQGLGFAIPVGVVRSVYQGLKAHGRVHKIEAGVTTQSITPALAAGLGLPRDWGVVISDVTLGGAAKRAGVRVGDVVDTFDGHPVDSLASITSVLYQHPPGRPVALGLLRGTQRLTLQVEAPEAKAPADQLLDLASPEQGLVSKLGVLGIDVSEKLVGIIPPLLIGSGVVVAARTLDATSVETGLQAGDVIHAVNRTSIESVEGLRQALRAVKPGDPCVLQVERQGKLAFLAFDME